MNKKCRLPLCLAALMLLLPAAMAAGLAWGSVSLNAAEIIGGLTGRPGYETAAIIIGGLRLPRMLAAGLAGAALAAAGVLLQGATDNDLAAPNVIGVNAGAGCAVMLVLCIAPAWHRFVPLAAFMGAALTTMTVLALSFSGTRCASRSTVVLAGVAVSAIFNACISFLSLRYPEALSSYTSFSVGGFAGVQLENLALPAIIVALALVGAMLLAPKMNLFCLGDDVATSLGVRVARTRLGALLLASALCAAAVSFAGLLGFVGLIVPHIVRAVFGHDFRINLPAACLCGAILVILADLGGRLLFAPSELPAGILLAAIGAPFFLYLLLRRRRGDA